LPYTRIGKEVHSFAEDDDHTLWITTQRGLVHKTSSGKEEQFLIDKDSSSLLNQIYQIEREGNKFWLTTDHGLYLFNPGSKTFSSLHHQPGNVNSLLSDTVHITKKTADDKLWIGSDKGLSLLDTKSGTFRHFQNDPKDTVSISNSAVFAIYIDKKQNVWVGTYSTGLNRLDEKTGRFKRYLPELPVARIIEDSKGDLWCRLANRGPL
jgi:ligand-binding sensor domain-containing protein